MTTTVIEEYILPTLTRYIDSYQWRFNFATRLINMYYGTEYTQVEMRNLYQREKRNEIH